MSRLVISFSGGRTSGYMTWRILQEWRDKYDEMVVIFANTGAEHEKTLEFVNNCDKHFGFNTVWLEAEVQEYGTGAKGKVVTYETANRNAAPYEAAIDKYGIPNVLHQWCTDRLKMMPVRHYLKEQLGWEPATRDQVLGIRADEMDRMSIHREANRIFYPLVNWGVTKTMVLDWWSTQAFDLDLPEHMGNCVWCFKKSERKLMTIAKHTPEYFDFPARMERKHARFINSKGREFENGKFYRNHRGAEDIIASSREPFVEWTPDDKINQMGLFSLDEMDISNGCSESCEVEYI